MAAIAALAAIGVGLSTILKPNGTGTAVITIGIVLIVISFAVTFAVEWRSRTNSSSSQR